ncbi:MAG: primase-helicase family protein [Rhizomicrobium sp.]
MDYSKMDDALAQAEAENEQTQKTGSLRSRLKALNKCKDFDELSALAREIGRATDNDAVEFWGLLLQAASGEGAKKFVRDRSKEDKTNRKIAKRALWSAALESEFTDLDFTNEDDLVAALNKVTALVRRGEERRFLYFDSKEQKFRFLKERDARLEFAKFKLSLQDANGNLGNPFPGFKFWLESPDRREYARVVFDPKESRVDPDELNMWTDFATKERKGDWSLFRDHLEKIVCAGNSDHFLFLMAWLAKLVQEPWKKPGVAIVMRGIPGSGKGTLGEMLGAMIGLKYYVVTGQSDVWTGRFNSQLEQVLLLCADESFFAGSKDTRGKVKHLITSEDFIYERKGAEHYQGKNYTHIIITSNEDWVVPADIGDRRMFVLDVLGTKAKNQEYFAPLRRQMLDEGGLEAMRYDLARFDYSRVDFQNLPQTAGLADQIERGLPAEKKWLVSCLREGRLNFRDSMPLKDTEFEDAAVTIPKTLVFESFRESVSGYRDQWTDAAIGQFLHKSVPDIKQVRSGSGGKRTQEYVFPPLADMRAEFLKANPGFQWGDEMPIEEQADATGPIAEPESTVEDLQEHRAKRRSRFD